MPMRWLLWRPGPWTPRFLVVAPDLLDAALEQGWHVLFSDGDIPEPQPQAPYVPTAPVPEPVVPQDDDYAS